MKIKNAKVITEKTVKEKESIAVNQNDCACDNNDCACNANSDCACDYYGDYAS